MPRTSSITKYGRPVSVAPASSTLAILGWSINASACRSASNRAMTLLGVHAQLDDLERHPPSDRLLLLGHINHAATALADLLQQLVAANPVAGFFQGREQRRLQAGRLHEFVLFMMLEQHLNGLANCGMIRARAI